MNKDLLGQAIWEYHQNPNDQELITWTHLTEDDLMPVDYFFRSYEEMPTIEQKALDFSYGNVLDIGCGAGSHSLYLQNQLELAVKAIDISPAAVATAKARGVKDTLCVDIYDHEDTYDTLLMLMNGIGLCETLTGLQELLGHLKGLLNPGGQILLDSSDIIYLFEQDEYTQSPVQGGYYGEVDFGIRYLGDEQLFPWMYVDFQTLKKAAQESGYRCSLEIEGEHYDYLAKLTRVY